MAPVPLRANPLDAPTCRRGYGPIDAVRAVVFTTGEPATCAAANSGMLLP